MDKRELANSIRQALTMRQVVEGYGFTVDRAGFIRCPLHAGDNHGSFKVYDNNFYCFGCGAHGSAIDFTMLLFGLDFTAACEKLNLDYGLNFPVDRKQTVREHMLMERAYREATAKRQREAERQRQYDELYDLLWRMWVRYDNWKREYAPATIESEIDPRYVQAVQNIDHIAHLIDTEL